jgi:hypothetical protein
MRSRSLALLVAGAVACSLPRDADGTLDRVRGGTMRVRVERFLRAPKPTVPNDVREAGG